MDAGGLISPRAGSGVCPRCFNLIRPGFDRCYACDASERHLGAMVPISYSVGRERLHRDIADYKRDAGPWVEPLTRRLAAILDAFLRVHEPCLAAAAGVARFDLVTTVPSRDRFRDMHHPLRRIAGEFCPATRDRHERLLIRTGSSARLRAFDPDRYTTTRPLHREAVLLVDDMWTTGASAQSAAAALRWGGAGTVAAVVIARHLNREWHENDLSLRRLAAEPFDFRLCPLCAGAKERAA